MSYNTELQSNNADLQSILNRINALPEAGGGSAPAEPVLQVKSVTPTTSPQEVTADAGYDGLEKVNVGAMPTATQATPSISVSSAGLITASATQTAGYVSAGTKSATKQLTVQAAKTVTPTTSEQTAVASGVYTTGEIAVKGDANLKAENIKSGVSIFGVAGSYEGNSSGGGEIQIATGTFYPTSADISTTPMTITGLGFTPKAVYISLLNALSFPITQMSSNGFDFLKYYILSAQFYGDSLTGMHAYQSSATATAGTINSDKITRMTIAFTDDGFTITGSRIYMFTQNYGYVAIG